ncbi:MAG TPA: SMI1/KNR4 family protein [Kofleriaceae bacterium]|jgi:hypothetical protein
MPRNLDDGLREDELASLETTFGFRFPLDLRAFLRERPPISQYDRATLTVRLAELEAGESLTDEEHVPSPEDERWGWMDWRGTRREIETRLVSPFEGIAAYFQETEYWLPQWGKRPPALEDRMEFLSNAPVLIPIGGQHYMAAEPSDAGNPIFSIASCCAIDMIVAGCDLADYLTGGPRSAATKGAARHIRFWSDVLYTQWPGVHG